MQFLYIEAVLFTFVGSLLHKRERGVKWVNLNSQLSDLISARAVATEIFQTG